MGGHWYTDAAVTWEIQPVELLAYLIKSRGGGANQSVKGKDESLDNSHIYNLVSWMNTDILNGVKVFGRTKKYLENRERLRKESSFRY